MLPETNFFRPKYHLVHVFFHAICIFTVQLHIHVYAYGGVVDDDKYSLLVHVIKVIFPFSTCNHSQDSFHIKNNKK